MAFADLTDCRCYYELRGRGEPVLLLPGLGSTCRVWDPICDELSRDFCLIAPDNRDIGHSVGRRRVGSVRDFSADLLELLDHLQVEWTHVLALSLGGVIAQQFVHDHPSRVAGLVLVSSSHRVTPYLREMIKLVAQSAHRFPRPLFLRTMAILSSGPLFLDADPKSIGRRVEQDLRLKIPAMTLIHQLRCITAAEKIRHNHHITAPTLVMAGEHDSLIPSCYAKQLADTIPGSRHLVIPDAGHNPLVEYPQRTLPVIKGFLKGVEPRLLSPPQDGRIGDAA